MASEQSKKRLRLNWRGLPRNVSRREYERFQLVAFGAIASGIVAVGSLIMAVTGATLQRSNELADIEAISVAEAAIATTNRDLVKVSGYLVGNDAPTMPDDPALKVLQGKLKLVIRDAVVADDVTVEETLWEWSGGVDRILLTDNSDSEIPLAIDAAQFPVVDAEPEFENRPKIEKNEAETGDRHPSAVEYASKIFELDPIKWRNAESGFTELERQVLPYGQAVVVVAGLRDQQLVDPLGDRLRIELGTEAEMRATGQKMRWLFSVIWLPMAGAAYFWGTKAIALNHEFTVRSNSEV